MVQAPTSGVNPHTNAGGFDGHDLFLSLATPIDDECMRTDCNARLFRHNTLERCENAHNQRTIHLVNTETDADE